jgi:hypothetical protein
MAKKVQDLASLDREIARLHEKAKMLENSMDESFSYLQEHSSSLMINTLLSGLINKETLPGSVMNLLAQSDRLQKTLGNLAEVFINRFANLLDYLVNKISSHKD